MATPGSSVGPADVDGPGDLEVALLGPLEVRVDGRPVAVTAAQQRAVLAALALAGGRPVSLDRLLATLWPDQVPPTARTSLHNTVRRLRTGFAAEGAPELIETGPDGYRLAVGPDSVDTERFARLIQEARSRAAAGQPEGAATAYRRALDLWRDDPLADLVAHGWLSGEVDRLRETWIAVAEEWADVELATGSAERVVDQLTPLAAAWPWRESLRARLMVALQAAGRTAEALSEYVRARHQFVEELGVEPGPLLREAHARVLRLDAEQAESTLGPAVPAVPAQLPPALAAIIGRDAELARLTASLGRLASGAVTWVVSGTAGVGKSALAAHWARAIRDRFPDGQLFASLRGFDPQSAPLAPEEVVRGFLNGLGVPPDQVPPTADAAFGMYRTLLAGRRVLVVLDNARDADQVRPLITGTTGSLTLVTSRHELSSLAVTDAAELLTLDLLTPSAAEELLAERLGESRLGEEPAAVAEIVARCAGLPLALAVAAARVAARMEVSLGALADQLRAASSLDVLHLGDPRTDLRAVLSWSVDALDAQAALALRRLGSSPSAELHLTAVASLVGVPVRSARTALAALARAHLVTDLGGDRVTLHDLVREHARELAEDDTAAARHDAVRRLADHYLHTAHLATRLQFSTPLTFELGPCPDGVALPTLSTPAEGARWLEVEVAALELVTEQAATEPGLETHAWRLARTVNGALWDVCRWQSMVRLHTAALSAAERVGDRGGQADALLGLGEGYAGTDRLDRARECVQRAAELFIAVGERVGEADALTTLGRIDEAAGDYASGLEHTTRALASYREIGDRSGQAVCLNNIGWLHACQGDYAASLARSRQALELYVADADRAGQAYALDSMGRAYQGLGDLAGAIEVYVEAAAHSQAMDLRQNRALTLTHLGEACHAAGDLARAGEHWTTALEIFESLHHPSSEVLRSRLALLAAAN